MPEDLAIDNLAATGKGASYERLAFTFCKAATIVLLTGRFALPVTAGAATVFYLLAARHGVTGSRCILKRPLLIAAFWAVIFAVWWWLVLTRRLVP